MILLFYCYFNIVDDNNNSSKEKKTSNITGLRIKRRTNIRDKKHFFKRKNRNTNTNRQNTLNLKIKLKIKIKRNETQRNETKFYYQNFIKNAAKKNMLVNKTKTKIKVRAK